MSGLGSQYWGEVIEVLRAVIPVYDRVNRVISLGKDEEYRLRGIRGRVMSGNVVLDAGSGYGNMSRVALAEAGDDAKIVMYDPIAEMLANVKNYLPVAQVALSSGIFECMPFRDESFDAVLCGYSLRDAIQLPKAIAEMHRVLKAGGRLVIVDLGKPDNSVARAVVSAYLKYFLGLFAYFVAGKAGLKFKTLYGTYLRWPRNSELDSMLKEQFSQVQFDKPMMGGAVIIAAYK
ncbi:MAG: methylase [Candidatus Nitrososphaera sp. 13_1_40CM_48_12]|nr:MAG: methylase [Candidatus Nitrososphaera sp. 13_1_40CM_48_12]TLY11895.1 MAG: methyltransferase domain-containing protein [Nitrososphaerota archaeon]